MRVERVPLSVILPLRHAILRPGLPLATANFDGDDAPGTDHWACFDASGAVTAVLSVMDAPFPDAPGPARQLRGMASATPGSGAGSALIAEVQRRDPRPMWCNARLRAVPFYARHGWTVVSPCFDIAGVGPHHRMTWETP
jgi:predicted GNAT family N-acyltransferase